MNRLIIFLVGLGFFCSASVNAQETQIKTSTAKESRSVKSDIEVDTAWIAMQLHLSKKHQNSNPDSAVLYIRRALSKSVEIGYIDGIAAALMGYGVSYANSSRFEESKAYLKKAYPYCVHSYFNKDRVLARWNNTAALPYAMQGHYDTAINYYFEALKIIDKKNVNDTNLLISIYNNLGGIFLETKQYEQALFYLNKVHAIAEQEKYKHHLATLLNNIAANYCGLAKRDTAEHIANIALNLALESGQRRTAQGSYYLLGKIHVEYSLPGEALRYFKKAIDIYPGNDAKLTTTFQGIATANMDLGNIDSAIHYYDKALNLTLKYGKVHDRLYAYHNLAEAHRLKKRFEQAFLYQKSYSALKDSLLNTESQASINKLEVMYRSSQKDKEIIAQKLNLSLKENQVQRQQLWIAGISIGVLIAIFVSVWLYRSNRQKQLHQLERMRVLQQEQEIGNLKSMIKGEENERSRLARDLHDGIMVMLSAIKMKLRALPARCEALPAIPDYHEIMRELDNTSRELRRTAHNLMPDMLLEGGLVEAVFYFCSNIQQNTGLKIDFQQYGTIPRLQTEFELSLYRIIQELLQNILKHAQAGKAIVQLSYRDDLLYITIEDNGVGFNTEEVSASKGMGLKSLRTRIRALNGLMDLQTTPKKGTTVYLEFDIRSVFGIGQSEREAMLNRDQV